MIDLMESEAELVSAAQNGDRAAYGRLVQRYHPGVVGVVFRLCGDAAAAEDAAQDAFIQAWLHLSSFRPGTSLRNWLYRIAVNAALDALRRSARTAAVDIEHAAVREPDPTPERAVIQRERMRAVQQAVLSLPESCRAVLVLREYGGLSYSEIAAALDIPIGTVMSRLNYGRERLRERLAGQLQDLERE